MQQLSILIPTAVDRVFDYLSAPEMNLKAGDIVTVPFGKSESLGVVWGKGTANLPAHKLKQVLKHHDEFPPVSEVMRKFIEKSASYNCAPKGAMLKMLLPTDDIDKKGRVRFNSEIDFNKINISPLSPVQQDAADILSAKINNGFSTTLLDGVTGSGKTEVYFDTIAKILKNSDAQILILLPEIGLSLQWLERFKERFGFTPLVWNSGVTPAQKRIGWQAIAKGEARITVGARSALFLPYKKLALIIVDEEHDGSYKQEDGVIYHARNMAVARAHFEKIPIILVSATPSLESYHNAKSGKYSEISLPVRHGSAAMPDVSVIDMRKEKLDSGKFISDRLRKNIAEAVAGGHQAMLFLNRRGYAPLMLCRKCGHRFQCPDCSAWLVLHKKGSRLQASGSGDFPPKPEAKNPNPVLACHHCGYHIPSPDTCPTCNEKDTLHACGPGVERIFEEVSEFLPQARVAVMASDSSGENGDTAQIIADMSEKKIDILIGTQMIAKGYHFADLAVAGVVDADLGLAGGDLRASEKTYQLLHQLSGRAGRENVRGKVFLQSFLPDHPVIKALLSGERDTFLATELTARNNAQMPPFTSLAAVIIEGEKEEDVSKTANNLASVIRHLSSAIQIYGPAPAPLFMLRGKYRYRLLVKSPKNINLSSLMQHTVDSTKAPSSVRVKIDIDPQSFL